MIFPNQPDIHGFFIDPHRWKYQRVVSYNGYNSALRTSLDVPAKYKSTMNLYNYGTAVKGWMHFSYHQRYGGLLQWTKTDVRREWTIVVSAHWLHSSTYRRTVGDTAQWLQDYYDAEHRGDNRDSMYFNLNYTYVDDNNVAKIVKHAHGRMSVAHLSLALETIKWKPKID